MFPTWENKCCFCLFSKCDNDPRNLKNSNSKGRVTDIQPEEMTGFLLNMLETEEESRALTDSE